MALGHRAAVELGAGPIPAGPVPSGAPRLELELRNDVAEHDRNEPYAQLRRAFVYKEKPTRTPFHLSGHKILLGSST